MRIEELYYEVERARKRLHRTEWGDWQSLLPRLLMDANVQRCIGWECMPRICDLTACMGGKSGRVLAVRLDEWGDGIGHKLPVIGALLVRCVVKSLDRGRQVSQIIDGGNVSTGLALGYFAKRFNLNATLVVSRYFTDDVIEYLCDEAEGRLKIVRAPQTELGREREFYRYLVQLVREMKSDNEDIDCLWHAKHGGRVMRHLGHGLAQSIDDLPNTIVLTLGAGATLEGWAIPIKKRFKSAPKIVVAEHELCPLLELNAPVTCGFDVEFGAKYQTNWLREPPPGIPHMVLGPHYDEINPCIKGSVLAEVDRVVRYGEAQWRAMASFCRDHGLSVGNSSAVNLLVSRFLANCNAETVLTFLYEPLRRFYKAADRNAVVANHDASDKETTIQGVT